MHSLTKPGSLVCQVKFLYSISNSSTDTSSASASMLLREES